jgi:hypothetical protein
VLDRSRTDHLAGNGTTLPRADFASAGREGEQQQVPERDRGRGQARFRQGSYDEALKLATAVVNRANELATFAISLTRTP